MAEKGFVFILGALIFIGLIIAFFFAANISVQPTVNSSDFLLDNFSNEFYFVYLTTMSSATTIPIVFDLNSNLFDFGVKVKEQAQRSAFEPSFCFIAFDVNAGYVLGNFMQKECSYYFNGVSQGTLTDANSLVKEIFLNDVNISLCECDYNAGNDFSLYLKLVKGNTSLIRKS
ncbi:MAG: hypothetical protein ABH821_00620 [archaeon]